MLSRHESGCRGPGGKRWDEQGAGCFPCPTPAGGEHGRVCPWVTCSREFRAGPPSVRGREPQPDPGFCAGHGVRAL